ncbi:septal ring lytic transglycosylase RlpA family protein [Collimonas silvisoli]|uniref:septal ring lytic transglycosylase RlpA family protein n=1 Tax=Collimonas silvisoli TaxID=2825884 RepID=UPI001E57C8D9|nr:septal ring lytic transglycosylase RlpA family protein [Collimonas silvisoli]
MMSGKPLEITPGARSFWSPFLLARHLILLLAASAIIPAGADTPPDKPSVHRMSEDAPAVDGTAAISSSIPNSFFYSESMPPSVPDASSDQDLSNEHTVTSDQSLRLDEGMRLRPDLGTVVQRGTASWYGPGFHGHKSADGERFNMYSMTAAHPHLPLLSWVLVRNVRNNKVALLKVTDRGPYRSKRILDVSYAAAKQLGFVHSGTTQVEVRRLSYSEVSWVRRQLDEGIDVSTGEDIRSSVGANYESADEVQQKTQHDGK